MIARNWKGWFHAEDLNVAVNSSSASDIVGELLVPFIPFIWGYFQIKPTIDLFTAL